MKKIEITIFERGTNYRKGKLFLNGVELAVTIERREGWLYQDDLIPFIEYAKKQLSCAIPYGIYEVKLFYSPKFKMVVPHILNVPGWDAIEIHIMNQSSESEGCIGVGISDCPNIDWIKNSSTAFYLLMSYLKGNPDEQIQLELKEK